MLSIFGYDPVYMLVVLLWRRPHRVSLSCCDASFFVVVIASPGAGRTGRRVRTGGAGAPELFQGRGGAVDQEIRVRFFTVR